MANEEFTAVLGIAFYPPSTRCLQVLPCALRVQHTMLDVDL